jgi:GH24 family phage-related lysozyme (muramidase)
MTPRGKVRHTGPPVREGPGEQPSSKELLLKLRDIDALTRAVQRKILTSSITKQMGGGGLLLLGGGIIYGAPLVIVGGIITLCGGVGWAGWNWTARIPELVAEVQDEIVAQIQVARNREADQLTYRCDEVGFSEGAKEANELLRAYRNLVEFLRGQNQDGQNLTAERFRTLADDAYNEGAAVLEQALNVFIALSQIDVDDLEAELARWEEEARRSREKVDEALSRRIASHRRRIENYHEQERLVQQLLAESDAIETALETCSLEASELMGTQNIERTFLTGGAGTRLEKAMESARRVEERLRSNDSNDADAAYEDAGRLARKG